MSWRNRAAHWLREPLVHFLLIGAVVYTLLAGRPPDPGERRIVVDETVVSRLADRWTQSFRRVPSPAEMDGLIADYVKDEVYYREALRLGLDRNDEAVRRLMRNKLVATAAASAEASMPTDADLQALLNKDPLRYAGEARFDFEQVFMGNDTVPLRRTAAAAASRMNSGAGSTGIGTASPLPRTFGAASSADIDAQFGEGFAASLGQIPLGRWTVQSSGLGLHLVRVTGRVAAAPPKLAEIRQRLENDWRAAAIAAAEDANYRDLAKGYDIVMEAGK